MPRVTHGCAFTNCKTPEYNAWRGLKGRCLQPNHRVYSYYGGRGIKVCDRWLGRYGFENFLTDLGRRPTVLHSLDRIDNDGNYEPSNCRWATATEQVRNRGVGKFWAWDIHSESIG